MISRLLKDPAFRQSMMQAEDSDQMFQIISDRDDDF